MIHIDPEDKKEVKIMTRAGCPVMLFAYFKKQHRSWLGAYYHRDNWIACAWNKDGSYIDGGQSDMDLVMVKDLLESKDNGWKD